MSEAEQPATQQYRLAIRRPVTMAMLFLTILVFGWRSYQQLPINLMPDISYPTLTVRTEYEGAAPEDVEKLVTRPLEEMLSIVSGMVEISSVSSAGLSEIIMEFTWGTDMNIAQQDVRDRLDLFEPPREVTEKPVILRYDPTLDPVMRVAITATDPETGAPMTKDEQQRFLTTIRDSAERHLKSDLEAKEGIAQALVKGGTEEEIQINVDAERLKGLGLSLEYIVNSLSQQNINLSGGRLQEGKTEYLVRTLNEYESVEEIAATIVTIPGGNQLPLSSVADVSLGTKERESIVRVGSREAVEIEIFKEGDANTVSVCNMVRDLLGFERDLTMSEKIQFAIQDRMAMVQRGGGGTEEDVEEEAEASAAAARSGKTMLDRLPSDIKLLVVTDQSRFIVGSIKEVQDATVFGGLLALIVLFLFLREMKATLIIGIAIPISVVATFVPMFMRDISLNIMSLGGLALGVGMLVDNSIVVLESIFRCKEEGDDIVDAAERGTKEVGSAVTASTLTTISVFFPIAFVEGIAGQIFGDLALTVTFSLLASLLTALHLIPLIASRRNVALTADRDVVWALRAYHEGRREHGQSAGAAIMSSPGRAIRYIGEYFRTSTVETFGPSLASMRNVTGTATFGQRVAGVFAALIFLVLIPVYLLQVALRTTAAIIVSILFVVSLVVLIIFLVIRTVLRAIMKGPLWLFNAVFEGIRSAYAVVLDHSLRFAPIFLIGVAALSMHSFTLARDLGAELIPPMKQGEFGVRLEARAGTRLEETEARAARLEKLILGVPEVDTVTVQIGEEGAQSDGDRGENVAEFSVLLKDPENMAAVQDAIIERLRRQLHSEASPDEEITFTLPSLFSFKTAIELFLVGDDLNELRTIGQKTLDVVSAVNGVTDAELSMKAGYPEVIIQLDREVLAAKGISPGDVAMRLRREVQGEIATKFNRAGEKVDIRVRTDQQLLKSIDDLRNLAINDGAPPIPLKDVATIVEQEGPSEIRRVDQRQLVVITANVAGRDLGTVSDEMMAAAETVQRPAGYYFEAGGQFAELETSYASLRFALILAIFLVYVVMACQFESVLHPMLVMASVPLAFIGVIYALDWYSIEISIMVFLGGIILAGIVVNDAIVLVDYINQLRARGYDKRRAIVEAGQVRLRPIIMTTVTTVLGLVPMITATGEGSELRRPMAITVMAGLSSATILTLLVIPMVYYMFGGRDKPPPEDTV